MKIIFLLIITIIQLVKDDNVELPLSCLNFGGDPIFRTNFYMEGILRNYPINTYLSFSLLTLDKLNDSRISTSERIYLDRSYETHRYSSSFKFDDLLVENYSFYTLGDDLRLYQDYGFALGYHYKDESFSFVDILHKKGKISQKQFSFYNMNENIDKSERHFYLGTIPNNVNTNFKYKGVMKVNEELPTWGSTFNSIIHNGKEHKINLPCIISSSALSLISSNDVYLLFTNIFRKELYNHLCNKTDDPDFLRNRESFQCEGLEIKNDSVDIVIDNTVYKFRMNDFFRKEQLLISSNGKEKVHNFTGVILGMNFIGKFNVSLFDYERKQVEFYSDVFPIIFHNKNEYANMIYIAIVIIVLCFGNSIILIIFKHKGFHIVL